MKMVAGKRTLVSGSRRGVKHSTGLQPASVSKGNKNGAEWWLAPFARDKQQVLRYAAEFVAEEPDALDAAEMDGFLVWIRCVKDIGCNWNELSPAGIIDNATGGRLAVPWRFFDSSQAHSLGS
jgi:hypothetical protein